MIDYAETLADGIDFVRVDLYELGDKVYFGELTNVPEAGLGRFLPASWDEALGSFWNLPNFRPLPQIGLFPQVSGALPLRGFWRHLHAFPSRVGNHPL